MLLNTIGFDQTKAFLSVRLETITKRNCLVPRRTALEVPLFWIAIYEGSCGDHPSPNSALWSLVHAKL